MTNESYHKPRTGHPTTLRAFAARRDYDLDASAEEGQWLRDFAVPAGHVHPNWHHDALWTHVADAIIDLDEKAAKAAARKKAKAAKAAA